MVDRLSLLGRFAFLAGLVGFGLVSLFPPLNHDAAAILAFAQRMLAGERLYVDLIDVNPPLVFLLSLVPAAVAQWTDLSAPSLLCAGVLGVALISVRLSLQVIAQGRIASYPAVRALASPALLIALLVLPMHSFAQREHLLAIFTLPYLFAAGQRLEGKAVSSGLAVSTAGFAAFGFFLKPHFIVILVLVELAALIGRGPFRGFRAPEPWTLFGLGLGYLGVVLIWFPAYLTEILPLARGLYDHADRAAYLQILIGDQVPVLFLVTVIGGCAAVAARDGVLGALVLALIGAIASGILQGKGWDYHFLTARAFAMVLALLTLAILLGLRPVQNGFVLAIAGLALAGSGSLSPAFKAQREFDTSPTGRLLPLIERYASQQPVLWLTAAIYPQYPALPYARSRSASSYMSLWMLPSLYGAGQPLADVAAMGDFERRLFDEIGTSLSRIQPALVIAADPDSEGGFVTPGFDYLVYFRRHPGFEAEWKHYRAVARVGRLTLYQRGAG